MPLERYALTSVDGMLSQCLANSALKNLRFRRKYAIGPFVFDFVCPEQQLVIEVDGERPGRSMAYDWERAQYLRRRGYRVLRIWSQDIRDNPAAVIRTVASNTHLRLVAGEQFSIA
jgi:very-short-patch-repair endonuclease